MQAIWWGVFIVSLSLLIMLMLKSKYATWWLAKMGMHIVAAGLFLYALNWGGSYIDFHIPINVSTLAVIGVLGIPGVLLLAAIKLILIP